MGAGASISNDAVSQTPTRRKSVPLIDSKTGIEKDHPETNQERNTRISTMYFEFETDKDKEIPLWEITLEPQQWDRLVCSIFDYTDCDIQERVRNRIIHVIQPEKFAELAASSPPLDLKSFLLIVDEEVEKMEIYRKARAKFDELDVDHSGELDGKEITKLAKWILESEKFLAEEKDSAAVKAKVLARIDDNRDGKMGFKEFSILYEEVYRRIVCIEFAAAKFAELDKDGSGVLEATELHHVVDWVLKLEDRGGLSKDDKKKVKKSMMKRIDRNKDQRISLKEFTRLCEEELQFLNLKRRATAKFLSLDVSKNGFLTGSELIALGHFMSTICFDLVDARDQLLAKYDANKDGKIDLEEFMRIFADHDEQLAADRVVSMDSPVKKV